MDWRKYITEIIEIYRQEFRKLDPEVQKELQKTFFHETFLEPCQIEILVSPGEVPILVVHDKNVGDMQIKIHEDSKAFDVSEFVKSYPFKHLVGEIKERELLPNEWTVFFTRNAIYPEPGRPAPKEVAESFLGRFMSLSGESIKKKQVNTIIQSTSELRESISRLPESRIRSELTDHAKMIDKALGEISRIDKDIGGVRQLMAASKEYQDWRLLVSDVEILKKRSHVSKELFESEVKRIDQRLDGLKEIKFWSKRTVVDIILATIATASTIIAALFAAGIIHL